MIPKSPKVGEKKVEKIGLGSLMQKMSSNVESFV